jgi:3-phenylpropionate/trans-cinnamate dioxygenase ferredoxin reductase subunit
LPVLPRTFVIVGASLAAAAAAQALREEGFDGRIALIGAEPHLPYERPPLSKDYLRGEAGADILPVHPASWYEEHQVELRLGTLVTALDPAGPSVELESGERLDAEAVLLATGGRPLRVPAPPSDRILTLRTREDSDRIRALVGDGRRLVVVGAGFIGAEVAASARELGTEVVMLEMAEVPLHRALGAEVGRIYGQIHRDHGVDLRTGRGVGSVELSDGGAVVRTTRGDTVEGQAVVVGVGIEPAAELARDAGLEVDNGVVVDAACRTSAPGVFAAGDVANHDHPLFGRLRVEHFDNALRMGAHAARSMLGSPEPFDDPHWFWSDQYDVNLQYAGFARLWDTVVVRGDLEGRDGVAFYLQEGVLMAALGLNRGRDVRRALKLIGTRPDPSALRDEERDLRKLAP